MAHPILLPIYLQALAGALIFNPSFKRALESCEEEPSSSKRVKITEPLHQSLQARQLLANNEQGMALIKQMIGLRHQNKCATAHPFTSQHYAVCVSVPLVMLSSLTTINLGAAPIVRV